MNCEVNEIRKSDLLGIYPCQIAVSVRLTEAYRKLDDTCIRNPRWGDLGKKNPDSVLTYMPANL